jgi:hypothetical protein
MGVIAWLLIWVAGVSGQARAQDERYVSFCEVVPNPERYDQKIIVTSGIYRAGVESSSFADPACEPGDGRDWETLLAPNTSTVGRSSGWRRFERIIDKDRRAFVVVQGVFDAYQRYEGPLPAEPRLQELLRQGNRRFGHLNVARFRIRVTSVDYVTPAANEQPPPSFFQSPR